MLQIPIILDKFVMNCKISSKTYSMNIYVDMRKMVKMFKLGFALWLSVKGKMWDFVIKIKDQDK